MKFKSCVHATTILTVSVPPMIWVQNQLVGAQEGQKLTLECYSEAFPKSINYWTRDQDKIVPQGEHTSPINSMLIQLIVRQSVNKTRDHR